MRIKTCAATLVTLFSTLLVLVSCTSTKPIGIWSEAGLTTKPYKKILVLGVMKSDMQRRICEDESIKKLAEVGMTGIPGYTTLDTTVKL